MNKPSTFRMPTHSNLCRDVAALLLTSLCAVSLRAETPPQTVDTYAELKAKGTIVDLERVPEDRGSNPSMGVYRPGMGGAGGGLVAGIIFALKARPGARPAYFDYSVRLSTDDKREIRVAYLEEFPIGTCVEVLTEPNIEERRVYGYGLAIVRLAHGC